MKPWALRFLKQPVVGRRHGNRTVAGRGLRPGCEPLESRGLLSGGLGVDYTLMGGQWDDSKTITYSIAPDGVGWDQGINSLNSTLNAEYGGPGWRKLVAQALQTWAAATNLNFTQVGDGPYAFNTQGINQGDPRFGDIRIGGYNFGATATIAQTYGPPPNGETGAGDVELNTSYNLAPGAHYDLESVLLHELGHSLGLGESPQPSSVMYTYYEGARQALSPDDVEGIQAIYGPRSRDAYQSQGVATSATNALDLTPILNPLAQGQLAGLGLASIGDVEYFSVTAPQLSGATLSVAAIAQGFSLMSPKLSVVDPATGATLAVAAHPDQDGDIALDSVAGVQPGHRYLIEVAGATNDAFAVGSYGISLGFFNGRPIAPAPDPYAYNNTFATATGLGTNSNPTIWNLTLPSATADQVFTFGATQPGIVLVASVGADVVVDNASGQEVVGGTGLLGFRQAQAGRYYLTFKSPNGAPVGNYAFSVQTPAGSAPAVAAAPPGETAAAPMPVASTVEVDSPGRSPGTSKVAASAAVPRGPLGKPARPNQAAPGTGLAG